MPGEGFHFHFISGQHCKACRYGDYLKSDGNQPQSGESVGEGSDATTGTVASCLVLRRSERQ
jgi:hypothetical protein